ncbi:cytochrome c, class I [Deinococcus phoenicis]|uniref:Cytochrome c, class I n=1 Tax=Deinococcus phoenicis TaxID=1476583 RepID=A0A016QQM7_9DEIO|nr:c-type cytochrome [Deinococcus phoenicis]EYB68393.1 cytochrome c, class I [Deinococcus phoenicis]
MKGTVRRSLWLAVPLALAAPVLAAVTQGGPPPGGNPLALKYSTPNAARGGQLSATCQGCHGAGGVSTNPETPRLAGQVPDYVRFQLAAFRAKLRPSPVMQQVAAHLKDQDIADLAAYFASRPVGPAWKTTDAALRSRGQALFMGGDPARGAIACAVCHGTNGRGENRLGVASVTNQSPGYALDVLHEFKNTPSFGGLPQPEAMRIVLKPLGEDDLKALAAYISSMK